MVVSWLGINRFYFVISMKQSACHKSQKKDDTNLQSFTDAKQVIDSGTGKNPDKNCKTYFTICGHR
jgi:hypothetical protein